MIANRKGIVLAGGTGSRLWPLTISASKQLLPVYDKPMIYYPLTTLMMAGIREILIITAPDDLERFRHLLKDGGQWGIELSYAVQEEPGGIAQAYIIGANFVAGKPSALILGDNLFFGANLIERVQRASLRLEGATIFAYSVRDPERFGIVEFDRQDRPIEIIEKPLASRSPWAVTGLYFYDASVLEIVRTLSPSPRGELEITDVNRAYLNRGTLTVERLGRGYAWLDAGTHTSLLQAAQYIAIIEERQNLKIGSPEEVAYRLGYINASALEALADQLAASEYGHYLRRILTQVTA